jgi:hypothetical protein
MDSLISFLKTFCRARMFGRVADVKASADFLIKKRDYTVQSITAAAKERGWTFTRGLL